MRKLAALGIALILLAACSSKEEPERRRRKSSTSGTSTPSKDPAPTPQPERQEPDPEPAPAPTSEWWCVCYQSEAEAGPQPATACRELESQCRELEKRIAKGGRGLVAGSLSHGCRALKGEHPGDVAGGRDKWQPSKLAGAWTSEGACLLEGAGTGSGTTSGSEGGSEGQPNNFAFLMSEAIGELRLGMEAVEITELLGQPKKKDEISESAATGEFTQSWEYPDIGITLDMTSASRRGGQSLGNIRASAPCELKTTRGVGIGSTREEVERAYGDVQDKQDSDPAITSRFVAGSIYNGLIFDFEDGKVSYMFMGVGAE